MHVPDLELERVSQALASDSAHRVTHVQNAYVTEFFTSSSTVGPAHTGTRVEARLELHTGVDDFSCRSSTSRPYGAIGPPAQTACRASARRPQGLACVVAVGQCVLAQGVLALCWRCAWRLEFESRSSRGDRLRCGPSVELWNQGNIPNT